MGMTSQASLIRNRASHQLLLRLPCQFNPEVERGRRETRERPPVSGDSRSVSDGDIFRSSADAEWQGRQAERARKPLPNMWQITCMVDHCLNVALVCSP